MNKLAKTEHQYELMSNGLNMLDNFSPRYLKWIFDSLKKYKGNRILEIGGGVGNYSKFIQDHEIYCSTELSEEYVNVLKERLIDKPNTEVFKFDIVNDNPKQLKKYNFDTILCIGVLEHIEKDEIALKNMYSILKPGGHLLLFTPALQFIYGPNDSSIGHYRRYYKGALKKKFINAGFEIKKAVYHNIFGIIPWFITGKILKREVTTSSDLSLFDKFVPIFQMSERIIPPVLGLNVVCIGRKGEHINNI